jgi:hypothetical protein
MRKFIIKGQVDKMGEFEKLSLGKNELVFTTLIAAQQVADILIQAFPKTKWTIATVS